MGVNSLITDNSKANLQGGLVITVKNWKFRIRICEDNISDDVVCISRSPMACDGKGLLIEFVQSRDGRSFLPLSGCLKDVG